MNFEEGNDSISKELKYYGTLSGFWNRKLIYDAEIDKINWLEELIKIKIK